MHICRRAGHKSLGRHPLRGRVPVAGRCTRVMWRCTRYVALHPLCSAAPEQKGCSAYGSGVLLLVLRLLWWCVVACCAPLWATAPVGVSCCGAPVVGRCTRCVALHPLCSAAPEQKGCSAYGSGVAQSRTRKGAVSVGESVSNCDEDRNAMRTFHSPLSVLSVIHSG